MNINITFGPAALGGIQKALASIEKKLETLSMDIKQLKETLSRVELNLDEASQELLAEIELLKKTEDLSEVGSIADRLEAKTRSLANVVPSAQTNAPAAPASEPAPGGSGTEQPPVSESPAAAGGSNGTNGSDAAENAGAGATGGE